MACEDRNKVFRENQFCWLSNKKLGDFESRARQREVESLLKSPIIETLQEAAGRLLYPAYIQGKYDGTPPYLTVTNPEYDVPVTIDLQWGPEGNRHIYIDKNGGQVLLHSRKNLFTEKIDLIDDNAEKSLKV